jgi:hypothetical protein
MTAAGAYSVVAGCGRGDDSNVSVLDQQCRECGSKYRLFVYQ